MAEVPARWWICREPGYSAPVPGCRSSIFSIWSEASKTDSSKLPMARCRRRPWRSRPRGRARRVLAWWGGLRAERRWQPSACWRWASGRSTARSPFWHALGGRAWRCWWRWRCSRRCARSSLDHDRDSLPYRAGAYVFPIGVVDAQTAVVRVYRFPNLSDVSRRDRRVTLVFEGGVRFEFETADPALAEQLVQLVEQNRQRVSGDSGPPSSRELAALDPLADTGFKSPFTPDRAAPQELAALAALRLARGLGGGRAAGPARLEGPQFRERRAAVHGRAQRRARPRPTARTSRAAARAPT